MAQTNRTTGLVGNAGAKVPVRVATTANIVLSGQQTIDGVACVTGDRVLVKNQANGINNGIYEVDTGDWERTQDCDGPYDLVEGSLVYVNHGTQGAALFYVCTTVDPDIGTDILTWQVSAPSAPLVLPLAVVQGGTGTTTKAGAIASMGVIQVTGEAGAANVQTGNIDAIVLAYAADQLFIFTPAFTNTGPATVSFTGGAALAAKNVFANGAALVGGELVAGTPVLLHYDGAQLNIINGNYLRQYAQDLNPDSTADFLASYDVSAKLYKRLLARDAAPLRLGAISGLVPSNNVIDVINDIDFTAGSCRDATDVANMFLVALTKQSDAVFVAGTNQGMLDTGVVGNSDYFVWAIRRPDTGVSDLLSSLSNTAPTMPPNYTQKRLVGWFKRSGGAILAFKAYELHGGGIEIYWPSPTLDVDLANTLTTARRLDTVKVPLGLSVTAMMNVNIGDAAASAFSYIYNPDGADLAPSLSAGPLVTATSITSLNATLSLRVRTNTSGQIAARSSIATVDVYRLSTLGFEWSRC